MILVVTDLALAYADGMRVDFVLPVFVSPDPCRRQASCPLGYLVLFLLLFSFVFTFVVVTGR